MAGLLTGLASLMFLILGEAGSPAAIWRIFFLPFSIILGMLGV
jgi:hypothetical protein